MAADLRGYYINTSLPAEDIDRVQAALLKAGLAKRYRALVRGELVAIVSVEAPLLHLKFAEQARQQLQAAAPDLFDHAVVAFVDLPPQAATARRAGTSELMDLSHILAAQTDTRLTAGKRAVLVCCEAPLASSLSLLLREMEFEVRIVGSGREALAVLPEGDCDLLLLDLQLPDMHAWQMLAAVRELSTADSLITVVVAGEDATADEQAFGLGIARVDAFLVQPFGMSRLRQSIWHAFHRRTQGRA